MDIPKTIAVWTTASLAFAILLEAIVNLSSGRRDRYSLRNVGANIGFYILALSGVAIFNYFLEFNTHIIAFESTPLRVDRNWWRFDASTEIWPWAVLLVADDFIVYWYHRMEHRVRLYWATHRVHHSTTKYNLTVPFRNVWFPNLRLIFWMPLALFGFHPVMIYVVATLNATYQSLCHTETIGKLGPLEAIFVTPSHHRVHHGTQAKYIDKNFGSLFIVWDRMFGTFQEEEEQPIYGLTGEPEPDRPLKVYTREWLAIAKDFRDKGFSATAKSLLNPPTN